MTNEQINIAIAEVCGWTEISWEQLTNPREAIERKHYCKNNTEHLCGWLPDYCNDLNAMHEAENVCINATNELLYRNIIVTQCGSFDYYIYRATARHRAEALLKTIGFWEDEK